MHRAEDAVFNHPKSPLLHFVRNDGDLESSLKLKE